MGNLCYMVDPEDMLKACECGDISKVRQLLEADSTLVNAKGDHQKTPLHWAAETNFSELAELLVSRGADIHAEVSWGMTPLQWAANMGSRDVADILLAHGAGPQMNLWCAAGLGMLDVVQSFWDSPSTLKSGAGQTRSRDLSPQSGKTSQPGGPNLGNSQWGKAASPETYLELVSDAFYIASRNGHVQVAEFLKDKGADLNCRGFFGGTGLHWAAMNGHKAMVEFLITYGADLHLCDQKFNATPLDWALEGKQQEIVDLLQAKM
jgi:ankyrin repeat protein